MKSDIYYHISNEDYHNGEGVSKSQLDFIEECSGLYQWVKNAPIDNNKTTSLNICSAFHCLLLEPDEFEKRFLIPKSTNRQTKAGRKEYAEILNHALALNQILITNEVKQKLLLMRDSAMAYSLAKWIMKNQYKQKHLCIVMIAILTYYADADLTNL